MQDGQEEEEPCKRLRRQQEQWWSNSQLTSHGWCLSKQSLDWRQSSKVLSHTELNLFSCIVW
jgi:hypothetical protein